MEHEGVLYVETRNAHEVSEGNTRVLTACEGGWAPVGAGVAAACLDIESAYVSISVDIEMRNTGGAAVGSGQNVSAGALESTAAGSRTVAAKKARNPFPVRPPA